MSNQPNQDHLSQLRHSAAHLLAAAVLEFYPDAKPTIGPSIDDGFYYDFDFGETKVSEEDLDKIEQKMKELVKDWNGFERIEVSREEALDRFKHNEYKQELINEFSEEEKQLSFYKSGEFTDLCRGGHVEAPSKELKHFKLLSLAGAYWRGSAENKMLTRIYGTAFPTKDELAQHLNMLKEARLRDHRKFGKELDLFTFSELIGSGFPLYTPRGAFIRLSLNQYIESLQSKHDYQQVWTPQVAKADLFKTSGHYDKYKDDMFRVTSNYSEEEFFLKPMNCPQHTQIYASQSRSYRDLPIRLTDFAMLYRDEKPGELLGLARVRSFSQDDCHIFCREDQVDEEIDRALSMTKEVMNTFGFKYKYRLSTRDPEHPEKYLGHPEIWDKVEKWAEEIMDRNGIEHYNAPGEAAFYAPKMDLIATDALGREWQLSTVQIDYVMPERFGLEYTDTDGKKKAPIMLHRAIIGSPERFIMILLEHFAGALPLWLSPVQVQIVPVGEDHFEYSKTLASELKQHNIRAEVDEANETVGNKIRKAAKQKVPYILVIGDKEIESGNLMVRKRGVEEQISMDKSQFISQVRKEIEEKTLDQ